ncbi:hypothetical protein NPIL_103481 [Nephila pilipes]|uniref:Uncharacterized protein n=1 Tax=Nephila pilipes TaxID=299642 RepID=A0A8X6PXH0_NEPPI|nr:hypothetical protein NPIL_103481 [Nephila pilipes]
MQTVEKPTYPGVDIVLPTGQQWVDGPHRGRTSDSIRQHLRHPESSAVFGVRRASRRALRAGNGRTCGTDQWEVGYVSCFSTGSHVTGSRTPARSINKPQREGGGRLLFDSC